MWINLDRLFPQVAGAPRHVIAEGLDLSGQVSGRLHGRFPGVESVWCGVVDYELSYAGGRRNKVSLTDQLLPFSVLRERN